MMRGKGIKFEIPFMEGKVFFFHSLCKPLLVEIPQKKEYDMECLKPGSEDYVLGNVEEVREVRVPSGYHPAKVVFNKRGDRMFAVLHKENDYILAVYDLNNGNYKTFQLGEGEEPYVSIASDAFGDRAIVSLSGKIFVLIKDRLVSYPFYENKSFSASIDATGSLASGGFLIDYNVKIPSLNLFPDVALLNTYIGGPCKDIDYCVEIPGSNITYRTGGQRIISSYFDTWAVIKEGYLYYYRKDKLLWKKEGFTSGYIMGDMVDVSPSGKYVLAYTSFGEPSHTLFLFSDKGNILYKKQIYYVVGIGATERGAFYAIWHDKGTINVMSITKISKPSSSITKGNSHKFSFTDFVKKVLSFLLNVLHKVLH